MRYGPWQRKSLRALILASTPLFCIGVTGTTYRLQAQQAQQAQTAQNRPAQFDETTRRDMLEFSRFLDDHQQVADQLKSKPWLVTNYDFLQANPDLKGYLQAHPQLSQAISQNPSGFVNTEERLSQPGYKQDLAQFDRFLDTHRDVAQQLRTQPWLASNYQFLQSNPDLNTFLQDHPQLKQQVAQNPVAVTEDAEDFNRVGGNYDNRGGGNPNGGDAFRRDVAEFNRFLDSHPEEAEQLRKNPNLVDDRAFVQGHPALQTYLRTNPNVAAEIRQNPDAFMRAENGYDAHEDARNNNPGNPNDRDRDVNNNNNGDRDRDANNNDRDRDRDANNGDRDRREVADFNRFLDDHREIGEQVRRNPSLLDSREFVQNHQALQTYYTEHPQVRDDIRQNPNQFMQQEDRFAENRGFNDGRGDFNRDHLASFNSFLGEHRDIARDVNSQPSRVTDETYINEHVDLKVYLNANPDVQKDIASNPDAFVKSAQQVSGSGSASGNGSGSGASTGSGATGTSTTGAGADMKGGSSTGTSTTGSSATGSSTTGSTAPKTNTK